MTVLHRLTFWGMVIMFIVIWNDWVDPAWKLYEESEEEEWQEQRRLNEPKWRPWSYESEQDAEDIHAYASLPEVSAFLPVKTFEDEIYYLEHILPERNQKENL